MNKRVELPTYEGVVGDAMWVAEEALRKLLELPEYTDTRAGGYLVLMEAHTGAIVSITRVGVVMPEKEQKYISFASEKARRLFATHKVNPDIVTSWQSRNPDDDKWGGAIWSKNWIVSFSGLPELADEAMSLSVAAAMEKDPMPEDEAKATAAITSNPYTELLLNEVLQ